MTILSIYWPKEYCVIAKGTLGEFDEWPGKETMMENTKVKIVSVNEDSTGGAEMKFEIPSYLIPLLLMEAKYVSIKPED